jgi:membrane-bound lytic murein transglycosylase D
MSASSRVLVLVVLATLVACAGQPIQRNEAAAPPAPAAAASNAEQVSALYARMDADEKRFATARAATAGSDGAEKSAADARAALDDLLAASAQCQALHECEGQRFVAALDHLLRQDSGLLGDDAGNPAPDGAETSAEAGVGSPVAAALPEVRRSVAMLKGRELSDLIALNDPVKVALEQWLTQLRPNLMLAYENYEYLRSRMWPEYQRAGLPEALLFGMLAKESGGKVHAVSRSGASGPLQFMYATGARFGLTTFNGFDQRFDPQMSARANAAYINEQLSVFNDNLELVLGAYNGGEGAMQRLANRNPDASFWDPKVYFELSPETREYVPMVLAAAWLFLHPERYHLTFPHLDSKPAALALARATSIDELTICLGQEGNPNGWFRTLRNLNPAYEPQQALAAGTRIELPARLVPVYEKHCAAGKWVELASELHSAAAPVVPPGARMAKATKSPPPRASARGYVVHRGESLGVIGRKTGCAVSDLASANRLKAPGYPLHAGQTLLLPSSCRK